MIIMIMNIGGIVVKRVSHTVVACLDQAQEILGMFKVTKKTNEGGILHIHVGVLIYKCVNIPKLVSNNEYGRISQT